MRTMRILFVTSHEPSATRGGTSRATVSVATLLARTLGCDCHSAFFHKAEAEADPCFAGKLDMTGRTVDDAARLVRSYVREADIDVVVNQGLLSFQRRLRASLPVDVGLVLCHHFAPGWEGEAVSLDSTVTNLRRSSEKVDFAKNIAKLAVYPARRFYSLSRLKRDYRHAYDASDIVVLLSDSFEEGFRAFAGIDDAERFRSIPNPLTYRPRPVVDFSCKKKRALIVARLDERQKRISLALDVWKAVKREDSSNGWELRIVGYGPDEGMYREKVAREGIPDVVFTGWAHPGSEYEQASLFMMTSASEGLPIVLTEAQQHGVVPIAFDSFASLGELVVDGENGFVISPYGDTTAYASAVLRLMSDGQLLERMSHAAAESTLRFSDESIVLKWEAVLEEAASCRHARRAESADVLIRENGVTNGDR